MRVGGGRKDNEKGRKREGEEETLKLIFKPKKMVGKLKTIKEGRGGDT